MTTAFVLGNGLSRKNILVTNLQPLGKIYACNAIYRDFCPSVLVATDKPIATQIQESGYSAKNIFYTRKPIQGLGAKRIPQDYYGYSSGPVATALAALDKHRTIFMLGFDMGPSPTNKFNNVYANTEFYKTSDALPTFTGNWIKQIVKIAGDFPRTTFIRVKGPTTADISEFLNIKNLVHEDLNVFLARINS